MLDYLFVGLLIVVGVAVALHEIYGVRKAAAAVERLNALAMRCPLCGVKPVFFLLSRPWFCCCVNGRMCVHAYKEMVKNLPLTDETFSRYNPGDVQFPPGGRA